MPAAARFDLKMAPPEKGQQLLGRESRVSLSQQDFAAFAAALDTAFNPNAALQRALTRARQQARRV